MARRMVIGGCSMPGKCDGGAWRVMDPKSFACLMNSYRASSVRVSLSPSREQSSCHAILFGYLFRSTAHYKPFASA